MATHLRTTGESQAKDNKAATDKTYGHQGAVAHSDRQRTQQNSGLLGRCIPLLLVDQALQDATFEK